MKRRENHADKIVSRDDISFIKDAAFGNPTIIREVRLEEQWRKMGAGNDRMLKVLFDGLLEITLSPKSNLGSHW